MMKIFLVAITALFFVACNNSSTAEMTFLTPAEWKTLDSMQFDKTVVIEVKKAVDTTFQVLQSENRSGQVIPEKFMPKMIKFDLNYLIDENKFAKIVSTNKNKNYTIHKIFLTNKTSIIISKL
jgi:hypothetical protein